MRSLALALLAVVTTATVTAQPTFTKAFAPSTVGPGSVSTLTFTLSNPSGSPVTGLSFSDSFPTGMTVASPSKASTTCSGGGRGGAVTLTAAPGGGSIAFSGGALPGGEACTVQVDVVGSTVGTLSNTSGPLASSAGSSPPATADLVVATDRPGFTKAFSPATVPLGGRSRLTFTIDNTANPSAMFSLSFEDTLPAGMTVAVPANAVTTCAAGTVTAPAGGGAVSYSAPSTGSPIVAAGATCTVSLDVVGGALGNLGNTSGELSGRTSATTVTSGKAAAVLTVAADRLALVKTFVGDPVAPGGAVSLEYGLTNLDRTGAATDLAFADGLDAALSGLVATGLPVPACGGTLSSPDGGGTVHLTGGALGAGASCTITVPLDVPSAATPGTYPSTTSPVTGTVGGAGVVGSPASDDLFVASLPVLTKAFVDDPVSPGSPVTLRFEMSNASATSSATDLAFQDQLTQFLPFPASATLPAPGFCGPGATAQVVSTGGGVEALTVQGASLGPGASCAFDVILDVPVGTAGGSYPNTTSEITGTIDGVAVTGDPASDVLDILIGPLLQKAFVGAPAVPGGAVTLTFDLELEEEAPASASGITFTDDLEATLPGLVATGLPLAACGGTLGSTDGGSTLAYSDGSMEPGEACTFSVELSVPSGASTGSYENTTSPVTATVGGAAVTSRPASDILVVAALSFTKAFDGPASPGGPVDLTFTIANLDPSATASNLAFSDDLDDVLPGLASTSGTLPDVCGTGSQIAGTSTLLFQGGTLAPGASCTFTVSLAVPAGALAGVYTNATSVLAATVGGSAVAIPPATDALDVVVDVPPAFAKAFEPATISVGAVSTLTLTIDNGGSGVAATGLDVSDPLPSGVAVAATPNASTTCTGGTLTADAGTGTVAYTGGSVAGGATCTVAVDVTASTAGTFLNTTGDLTSSLGNSGSASASLEAVSVDVSATKTDALPDDDGDGAADAGETIRYTVAVANGGARETAGVVFDDSPGANTTLVEGSVTTTQGTVTNGNGAGDAAVSVALGTIAAGGTVTVMFDVVADAPIPDGVVEVCNQGAVSGTFPSVLTDDPDTPASMDATCVLVDPNEPPVADAGDDRTVECAGPAGAAVALDGSASSDPDGDALTYVWTGPFAEGGGTVTGVSPTVTLPLGTHTIALTVSDPSGASASDEIVVTVGDTTGPVLTVGADPLVLWPPNHGYRTVDLASLGLEAADVCDSTVSASSAVISLVTSDEPEDGTGDGNTLDDIVVAAECDAVDLRAERRGNGNGRVYTLELAVADASGNAGTASYQVWVPKNASQDAVADAPQYAVPGCPAGAGFAAGADVEARHQDPPPEAFALEAVYPNPSTQRTTIVVAAPDAARVRVSVYDALGREVARPLDETVEAGRHEATFTAGVLPSGMYLVRMEVEGAPPSTRTLTVLR